uniref:BURP domain-containing protein n=1 Tax=Chenopodium quinoa TaxID=63459 RepID=A0A803MBX3_CHEQI
MVACHTMPYPYVVYLCHFQESESKVFQVSLRGEDNNIVHEAVAVCHMDTSQWSPDHASFWVLGIKPGSSPVCHFFPTDNLVWVPIISYTTDSSVGRVSS